MNPVLTYNLDFSFFKSFFSSDDITHEKEKKTNNEKKKKKESEIKEPPQSKEDTKKNENLDEEIKKNDNVIKETNENQNTIKDTNEDVKKEEKKTDNKIKAEPKKLGKKEKKTKDGLLNFLVTYIRNVFIFKKKVKELIKKHKDNYAITSSVNSNNLSMAIKINDEHTKKINYVHEPILNENIFYIPRKLYKKKNLVKFLFVNKKNESIIDPKFNTEYDSGEFINVINLKKIKNKEEEREEEFQTFLESYYTIKPSKQNTEINKLFGKIRVSKKHRTMDISKDGLNFGSQKFPSNSILKQRPIMRVRSNKKKITFSDKNETLSYKKDD